MGRGKFLWLTAMAVAVIILAGCGTAAPTAGTTKVAGGTATFALPPDTTPNYIFPLSPLQDFSVTNLSQFQYLMYRPLYWFGDNGSVNLNPSLSLANTPVYTDGGKSVTIVLKPYKWSDGTPVTTRDIVFWMNLLKANKANWAAYLAGDFPDNVASWTVNSSTSITFHLTQVYSDYWFTYNELSQVTPIPQQAWDKTSATGAIGNYDEQSPADAVAVYNYLANASKNPTTFATNPLWGTVDGPFKLQSLTETGQTTFVPNANYSGPVKPSVAQFVEVPYTGESAEVAALKKGTVDFGYLPTSDLPLKGQIASQGYTFAPWLSWSTNYMVENFTNPKTGPIFKQLYVRQAFQYLVNQQTIINSVLKGYGSPDYGPVPLYPSSQFIDSYSKTNPYPYSVSKAQSLLTAHGWTVVPSGVTTCADPGTGSNQCGANIAKGAQMDFNLQYASGQAAVTQEMEYYQTQFAEVGIKLNLSQASFNTVISAALPTSHTWDIENWGGGWLYSPDYYPTGEELYATGAGSNSNGYSDPEADSLITATTTSSGLTPLYNYEDYLTAQLPVMWEANPDYSLVEVKNNLKGTTPLDPLLNLNPENWYFTK